MTVLVFRNLNVAVCGDDGEQIGKLQVSLIGLLADHFEKHGYNPEGVVVETKDGKWKIFKTTDGNWNCRQV